MFTSKVEIISTEQKYHIQFATPFLICLGIMILEKVYLLFDDCPELFAGADVIYHIASDILTIATQLAASVAAAIIFYYCTELLYKKRDMEKYIDMRRSLLLTMYSMMELLERFDAFSIINCTNTGRKTHDISDVEPFCACLKQLKDHAAEQALAGQINEYVKNHVEEFSRYMRLFQSSVHKVYDSAKQYRYFRNSLDNATDIKNIFEDLDTVFAFYKEDVGSGEIDEEKALNEISQNLMAFVFEFVDYETKLGTLMAAINRKQIFTFMRLLD